MRNKTPFFKSTLILMLGGMITRFLGFIIKILYTRIIGSEGITLYMLVMPTYSLLLSVASLGLPVAISKIVAERKEKGVRIFFSTLAIVIVLNFLLILVMLGSSSFIANTLLKEPRAYYLLISATFTLPFVSITSILKGYFMGKQNMIPNTVSNVIEQGIRIVLILMVLPLLMKKSVLLAVCGLILTSVITEISSIITFFCYLPKKMVITKKDITPQKSTIDNVLHISLPTVSSRFIGNIGFFFEPILLTQLLFLRGYPLSYISFEYGAYNAYSIAVLTMPAFFIGALSQALLPEISKLDAKGNQLGIKKRLRQVLGFSFVLGILFSSIAFVFREDLLQILYHTTSGSNYIKVLAPFFVLFYLEAPLMSTLQALGYAKTTMFITFVGEVIKLGSMALLCFLPIGIYSLVFAEIINIIVVVFLNVKKIRKILY